MCWGLNEGWLLKQSSRNWALTLNSDRFIVRLNDQPGLRRINKRGQSVQVIDNWATVTGEITEIRPSVDSTTLMVKVSGTEDFEDFPNLFTWAKGQLITVELPKPAKAPDVGSAITWRMRIVSPGNAMPHQTTLAGLA